MEIRGIVNNNINERVSAALSRPQLQTVPRVIDTPRTSDTSLLFINMPINLGIAMFDPGFSPARLRLINFVHDMSLQVQAMSLQNTHFII